ncbi:MAG: YlxR family protein [Eubacterium sp.]|nr:YlxR family protein [Eubacterium sp.]MBQ9023515.1 YlxR family protein [Eubacterium sp.]
MKNSKSTQRMCVGCRQMIDKKDLIRLVRTPEGSYELDPTGKKNGRGAYICQKAECMEKAVKNNGFQRSFKGTVPKEALALLTEEINRRK